MQFKICGMKDEENIREVSRLEPDFMGFIFYPKSPRYVDHLDKKVLGKIPASIRKVGVFVNEQLERTLELAKSYSLDMLQLHGGENPEYCKVCRKRYPVIKAFAITPDFEFQVLEPYVDHVDYFLFDTRTEKYGGSGVQFDWNILKKYTLGKPYFLSGGIGVEDLEKVFGAGIPAGFILDINSRIETRPGLKDVGKVKHIKETIRRQNSGISAG